MQTCYIKEIFASIQGEALYIGEKQLFIRFCDCNLNCAYCDTDFSRKNSFPIHDLDKTEQNPISSDKLAIIANNYNVETISLTGGEPLLHKDFLLEFLPKLENKKIYLETNGVLFEELNSIIKYVDIVSMDIKLPCSTNQDFKLEENKKFIKIATENKKEIFAKIILDKNYSKDEIIKTVNVLREFDIPLIIQPMDCKNKVNELNQKTMKELLDFVLTLYPKTRFIPQVHKYLKLL